MRIKGKLEKAIPLELLGLDVKVGFNAFLELGLDFGAVDLGRSGRSWCGGLDAPRERAWSC